MNKQNQSMLAVSSVVALILSGCATTRIDPPLVAARDEVAKVQANPDAERFAQPEIAASRASPSA